MGGGVSSLGECIRASTTLLHQIFERKCMNATMQALYKVLRIYVDGPAPSAFMPHIGNSSFHFHLYSYDSFHFQFSGAVRAVGGSYFGSGDLPIVMAYTDCYGSENQLANCSGFHYSPYIPHWYCSDQTLAGVVCSSKPLHTL